MKKYLLPLLAFFSLPALGQTLYDQQLKLLYKKTVPIMYSKALATEIKKNKNLYILDTRSAREYQVSHLPKAQFVNYDAFKLNELASIPKSATVVIYCSVGVRSERIGEKLLQAGYSHVYNLYGGIFQWKNEKYPVFSKTNQPTDSVHTYNKLWSVWLQNGVKVYE